MNRKTVAIVPMRHDSERVPGKNYRQLGERPLFCHIVDSLFGSGRVDQVVIDTDSETIRSIARRECPAAIILERPRHLRDGKISMNEVLQHTVTQIPADIYLQTHSTNPLLSSATIAKAVDTFARRMTEIDSMFSVTKMQQRLWDWYARPVNHNPSQLQRTQDLSPVFTENSCLYLFTQQTLDLYRSRIGGRPAMFEIDKMEAWDIDEEIDFTVAEMLFNGRQQARRAA